MPVCYCIVILTIAMIRKMVIVMINMMVITINHKETKFEQKSEKNRLAEAAMFYEKKKPFGKIIFTLD